jgi:hypothetical protein
MGRFFCIELYCPLLASLARLDSHRSFQRRKNMNHDLFSQSRCLIKRINLKRNGVGIWLGKDVGK